MEELNPKQLAFCELYASDQEFFGNGAQSYAAAYGIDLSVRGAYATAVVNASRLLTNAKVLNKINDIFESRGLNDSFVDKQLEKLITQDADFKSKLGAIKEYNSLKQRVTKKLDVTTNGESIAPADKNTVDAFIEALKNDTDNQAKSS